MEERGADWEGRQIKEALAWVCDWASACLGGQSHTCSRPMPSRAGHLRISGATQSLSMKASAGAKTEWRMLPALILGYHGASPFLRLRRDS